jgi:endogenous inhibitor of DNA gyrase (YacG/DUF329 family)
MIEQSSVLCPFCQTEITVKTIAVGSKITYLCDESCPKCGKPAAKIEAALNRGTSKSKFKVEKSYIKLDPRG